MRWQNCWLYLLSVMLLAGGCASPFEQGVDNLSEADAETLARLRNEGAVDVSAPRFGRSADAPVVSIPADVGAEDYVALALQRNPGIRAAQLKVARLQQRIAQVTSLNDPMLSISPIGDMAETAAGQATLMAGLSQKLPFPGKLEQRGRIAEQTVAAAAQDLEAVRLAVAADTRRAFWSHYAACRVIELTEQSRQLLDQFKSIAEAKYRAGTATQQDVLRASVELSNLENELITWHQRRTTAGAMLNSLIDRPVTTGLPQPAPVELTERALALDRLLNEAGQVNPAIVKIREHIEEYRQRHKLARLNRWPDVTAMASYVAVDDDGLSPVANGDDQWWFGFGVNLPIWTQRLDAAEREALQGIMEQVAALHNTHNRVAFRVQEALTNVETQQRLALLLRDVIVPQARQTVESSLSGYRAGKIDFLTLVDNWRRLLNFQLTYHRTLGQLEKEYAALQQAVGSDLSQVDSPEPAGEAPEAPSEVQP